MPFSRGWLLTCHLHCSSAKVLKVIIQCKAECWQTDKIILRVGLAKLRWACRKVFIDPSNVYGLFVIIEIFRMDVVKKVWKTIIYNGLLFFKFIFRPMGSPAVYTSVQKLLPRFFWSNLRKRSIRSNTYLHHCRENIYEGFM